MAHSFMELWSTVSGKAWQMSRSADTGYLVPPRKQMPWARREVAYNPPSLFASELLPLARPHLLPSTSIKDMGDGACFLCLLAFTFHFYDMTLIYNRNIGNTYSF